jgi:hypothetical protein
MVASHLHPEPGKLLLQALRLHRKGLGRLMAVGRVELAQIARHTLLELRPPPLHLASREVLVAIVHRLELAAVDRHTLQSSRQSGNSVLCPRSTPATKRFIRSPASCAKNHTARIT